MNRRTMLKTVAFAGAAAALPARIFGQSSSASDPFEPVVRYLSPLARPDGGYAWEEQEDSHLTPTFAVIGCYRALKKPLPEKNRLAQFVRSHHPSKLKKLEQEHRIFDFQQIQSLVWLGEDVSAFRDTVLSWKQPVAYLKQYEQHGCPVFKSEMAAIVSRGLLGIPTAELPAAFVDYLDSRRRDNGSFNNTPTSDGGDGHILNTWWGLRALQLLGRESEKREETIAWLRACQLPSGGFTFAPKPEFGGVEDVAYTWAAIHALNLLGAPLTNSNRCVGFLHWLANADGGFSDRPGWQSNPLATYYALDALDTLGALTTLPTRKTQNTKRNLPSGLKVFSIQIESPGQGSPSDAVQLAADLKIDLWGAKNSKPEWIARAQQLADAQRVPVKFFVANEEYGTWVNVPGLGTYSHTSDIIAPTDADFGSSLANKGTVSWAEFRERRLSPLQKPGGRLIWQFGENEELARMFLDDSVERGGFAAISTFHFGNPDFTNAEPFLQRWRGQIPFVALQDAHATEPWWGSDNLAGFRTLFLATQPTWDGWLEALKQNWVVAVRHDAVSSLKTWMHGGSREVLDFVRERESDWKWWAKSKAVERPLVTASVLHAGDAFEAGAPAQGAALRIRCWWNCTVQGVLKKPMVELVRVTLDNETIETKPVEKRNAQGAHIDQYHLAPLPRSGRQKVVLSLRMVETGKEEKKKFEISV